MSIPSTPAVMRGILDRIRSELEAGRTCYVHCWGGIGRTGTVIGCWLKESGMDSRAALDEVQQRYFTGMEKSAIHPNSPQTPVQVRYVRNWPNV
jgi:protein-tyrosine phosphatase